MDALETLEAESETTILDRRLIKEVLQEAREGQGEARQRRERSQAKMRFQVVPESVA